MNFQVIYLQISSGIELANLIVLQSKSNLTVQSISNLPAKFPI